MEDLSFKREMLPLLLQEFSDLKLQQRQREQQLDRLLALVAGTSQLNTFLAQLNDISNALDVTITTTEPGEVQRFTAPAAPTGQEAPPAAGGGERNPPSIDSLLNKGLEKRSAGLTVKGPFTQVLAFLQALELLQVFVIISKMDVQADIQPTEASVKQAVQEVTMTLKLRAYGRQPGDEPVQEPI